MTDALAEALRELLDSDSMFYPSAIEGDSLDLEDWATRTRAALAAYDAKREAALQELADLGQAWDAAPGPAGDDAIALLREADSRIIWEAIGFGNDFADRVERAISPALCKALAPQIVREAENEPS